MVTVTIHWILLWFFAVSEYTMCLCGQIVPPSQYTALDGDLVVEVTGETSHSCVQLLERTAYLQGEGAEYSVLKSSRVVQRPVGHQAVFPCGVIVRGGRYGLRLTRELEDQQCLPVTGSRADSEASSNGSLMSNEATEPDLSTSTTSVTTGTITDDIVPLDVRWPLASLAMEPPMVQTYPEVPVLATVRFQTTACQPDFGSLVPETWLDLVYCGHSSDTCVNSTHKQLLYSEQIRGYPTVREITLPCNSFGVAGHYALALRSGLMTSGPVIAFTPPEATLKAVWSDKFVFNVHARSIFPCDGHGGIAVLFQYPGCILESGDRVRVFGRERADVVAAAPPSKLFYLAERRVHRGQHALTFDCDLFTERYVEYCFVYVSQAVSGAVSDVRMDCVPTLPVHETESGGWGSWTSWTQCTTSCSGGTRNRYRLCDSPPPRYGAKFCEGHALETERCGVAVGWDCPFYQDAGGTDVPAERPEVKAEVGPGCRCGCVVHLGVARPRRLVASSSQSCPGRTFWLIQADRNQVIRLSLEQFRLPCSAQWLKVRDGDGLSSNLLAHLTGVLGHLPVINSSSNVLLLEFFSDELAAVGEECWGGFLAHVQQLDREVNSSSLNATSAPPSIGSALERLALAYIAILLLLLVILLVVHTCLCTAREVNSSSLNATSVPPSIGSALERLALAHIAILLLLLIVLLASTCLGAQYMHRYRKYQLAAAHDDLESLAVSCESVGSLVACRSKAVSSSTLLSEVISLRRFRPHRHMRLADTDPEEDEREMDSSVDSHRDLECREDQRGWQGEREVDAKPSVSLSDGTGDLESRPTTLDVPVHRAPKPHRQDTARIHKPYKFKSPVSPVAEGPECPEGEPIPQPASPALHHPSRRHSNGIVRTSGSSSVSSSLTNALSSPASSLRSNPKETKEKRNRERLMAGSEFSLAGDLEMDYYDYNVSNASAVPGSYLGMDPAFCVWIPPFAPGRWDDDEDDQLLGQSDTEETELCDLKPMEDLKELVLKTTDLGEQGKEDDSGSSTPVNEDKDNKSEKSFHDCYSLRQFLHSRSTESVEEIQMKMIEKLVPVSPVKVHRAYRVKEKETGLEKSPSDESEYYDLLDNNEEDDDIKFADEDDDEILDKKDEPDIVALQVKSNRSSYYDV